MQYGLLGEKLGHSYSPQIHKLLGCYTYDLVEKQPQQLEAFLKKGDFCGLNVTIPYKKSVIPYCDEISPQAQALGSVNTIVRRDGKLIGHNTDYFGFSYMVEKSGVSIAGKKVLVLGSGGASVTVCAVLRSLNANVVVISRSGENNYENIAKHADAAVIVNTTPVGMYPNTGCTPLNLATFPALEAVLDIVYNPARTQLLMDAERRGLIAENGLWMLIAQAKESAEWFTGKPISDTIIPQIYRKLQKETENIILIGMPGAGKSAIGKELAETLHMTFVDADEKIVEKAGMTIPKIFEKYGEEEFRKTESAVLKELGKESGLVIATGGGCVTRKENYPSLHQNGSIVWIHRPIEALPTEGRPLSQTGMLQAMYNIRKPMYAAFCDAQVDNTGSISQAVSQIVALLSKEDLQ